jgi:hypothetical protein
MHRKCKVVNICSSDYYAQENMVDSCKCAESQRQQGIVNLQIKE